MTVHRLASRSAAFAVAAATLSGCAAADGLMSDVALPPEQSTGPAAQEPSFASPPAPPQAAFGSPTPIGGISGKQLNYLDALAADGVHPSSTLIALTIGSYICQARTAGQNAQAVWDFVHPLVESDVKRPHPDGFNAADDDVDAATRAYIRVADDRLC